MMTELWWPSRPSLRVRMFADFLPTMWYVHSLWCATPETKPTRGGRRAGRGLENGALANGPHTPVGGTGRRRKILGTREGRGSWRRLRACPTGNDWRVRIKTKGGAKA